MNLLIRFSVPVVAALLLCGIACRKEPTFSLRVFREIPAPVAGDFAAVWMRDSLRGAAVGGKAWESGFILSTADGGQSWQIDTLLSRKMECVTFDREGQGYVCGQDFALYRPAGSNIWDDFRVNYQWNKACCFPDSRHGAMVTGGAFRFGDIFTFGPEAFWKSDTAYQAANALVDVQFSDSLTAHAVGLGWVLRSADGGRSWQRLDVTGDFFRAVCFPDALTGYICGSSGTLLKTEDGGLYWQEIRKGGSTGKRNLPFRSLWFSDARTGFVAGDGGLFWKTENGGADWSQVQQAPEDVDFTDVFTLGSCGWAVGRSGRIFYFEW